MRLACLLLAASVLTEACASGPRAVSRGPLEDPCRGTSIELVDAYAGCVRASEALPAPDATALELIAPDVLSVPSGGRIQVVFELHNRSGATLPLSFRPSELSATVTFGGHRIDWVCMTAAGESKEAAGSPEPSIVFLELLPEGVLRMPVQITAWATATTARDGGCLHGDEIARGPLPPGRYEARVELPWALSRSIPLEITPRVDSLGADWPRGEERLACTRDEDCTVVSGRCAPQAVNGAFAEETLRLHDALADHGACVPTVDAPGSARCLDAFCVL